MQAMAVTHAHANMKAVDNLLQNMEWKETDGRTRPSALRYLLTGENAV